MKAVKTKTDQPGSDKGRGKSRRLEALGKAAVAFFSSLELEQVVRCVADKSGQILSFEWCSVLLLDEAGEQLRVAAVSPFHPDINTTDLESPSFSLRDLACSDLFRDARPVFCPEYETPVALRRLMLGAASGPAGALLVPLTFDGCPLGLLLLTSSSGQAGPTKSDLEIAALLGSHAAAAVRNAQSVRTVNLQLFETVARGKREWEQTFDAISDGIFISSTQQVIMRVNKSFAATFGKLPRDIIGRKCHEVVWNSDQPCVDCPTQNLHLDAGGPPSSSSRECVIQGATSQLSTYPMLDPEGRLAAVVHVVKDVTEQKMMQELVIRAEKLRAVGEMASGIAHDFNNLLSSIIGWSEIMLLRDVPSDLQESATAIHQAALDGTETVKRIQEYTRIRKDTEFGSVDINEVVKGAVELARPRWKDWAEKAGLAFTITTQFADIPLAKGSASDLREVFLNIIFNAIDAMPKGGEIKIRTGRRGGNVFAAIADSGIGIPRDVQRRVFDPFFTTKGSAGSGLGLSVAFGIVSRHGGKLTVDSGVNRGSTFTVFLPVALAMEKVVEPQVPAPSWKVHVLLIDDDERVLKAIEAMLRSEGHAVTACLGGKKALAVLRDGVFDLVITDLGMPEVNGWEVAAKAKAVSPDLPVVILSGWAAEIAAERLAELGVDGIIQKPCRLTALRQIIHQVGTRFTGASDQSAGTEASPTSGKALSILVVEDNRWFGKALKERLEIDGHFVVLAPTGREGLESIKGQRFDLVLTDLKLPDASGVEVAKRIVEAGGRPRIAVMTGDLNAPDQIPVGEGYVDDILRKPWKEPELQQVLEKAHARRRTGVSQGPD